MKTVQFQPLHILATLGLGGLTASFFFVLNFMTVHPHVFIDYNTLMASYVGKTDIISIVVQAYALLALISAFFHFVLLRRWVKGFIAFKKTDAYQALINSNKAVQMMAIPLTMAMSMNVLFIVGAITIPGLFDPLFGEYLLFDVMLVGAGAYFFALFIYASKIFSNYWATLVDGNYDFIENSNLSQMIAIFSFGMIAVSLGAMGFSKVQWISFIGMTFSYIALSLAVVIGALKLFLGFKSIFRQGVKQPASVTLLLPVVIIAMFSLALFRGDIALMHSLTLERDTVYHLVLFTVSAGLSILVGLFALKIMREKGFFGLIKNKQTDASAFAFICPIFAMEVQLVLWLNVGLLFTGIVAKYSTMYFVLWAPSVLLQMIAIYFIYQLLNQHNFLKFETAKAA